MTTHPPALLNWAGNHRYVAERLHHPQTLDQLAEIVARSSRVRALGSRHSFTDIADTTGDLVSMLDLPRDIDVDSDARSVRVAGGVLYGDLATSLAREGWALSSMASLPHISVAGAVATGSHGSGDAIGSLASRVTRVDYLDPDGTSHSVSARDESFEGQVVALGALGLVTHLTLDVEPTFRVRQDTYVQLPWSALTTDFDGLMASAYSVSIFTDWTGESVSQVWLKSRSGTPPDELFGAVASMEPLHMLVEGEVEALTQQLGEWGEWHERLPHFRMEFTPSRGEELQSEYLLPRVGAVEAVDRLRRIVPRFEHLLQVGEIRTVAADRLWLSEAYGTDRVAFHFTWLREPEAVREACAAVEAELLPLGARPHWGKVFAAGYDELRPLYPHFDDFRALRSRLDPTGTFDNAFLQRVLDPS